MRRFWAVTLVLAFAGAASATDEAGLFFEVENAKAMLVDIQVGRECAKKLAVCDETSANLQAQIIQCVLKTEGLGKDKGLLEENLSAMEKLLNSKQEDLNKCMDSKPSRLTWFGWGVAAGLVTFLAIGFASR